ncbi:ribosome biosynthesis protein RRB1 [Ascoidea rubescens DSM 1968]|uniref:Ribosome assembly protein RRB1 n=1 Tax=Ascoidea rubescens DSM 1968 TaxID=1344418 RepID=A0A1D2VQY4_9ASCO|nr:ribosome assembly protein RRB1 [Ascoidea rubescens DSM 1968]ODV64021.1 ribosome assembly protein RRB1 [Ascoidea rubescens DSM 1968]
MSKRTAEQVGVNPGRATFPKTASGDLPASTTLNQNNENDLANDVEMGEFEDPYGDDFESDGEIIQINSEQDDNDDDGVVGIDNPDPRNIIKEDYQLDIKEQAKGQDQKNQPSIYLPHKSKPLGPDEVMEADPTVYEMLHTINLPWPCLTLDVVPDNYGNERRSYPAKMYIATATQASKAKDNELLLLKLSQLSKTLVKDNDDEEGEDMDEDNDNNIDIDPIMESESIRLNTTTNRIRVSPFASFNVNSNSNSNNNNNNNSYLTATMCEDGDVQIFDLSNHLKSFDTPGFMVPKRFKRQIHTIRNHGRLEGYGLDWSPLLANGALLSGDITGRIYFTQRTTSNWFTDKTPFQINDKSIEDIQWSKSEKTVFATAGCDGYIRIWDTRSKKHKPAISVMASNTDVNVISWSNKVDFLLSSGYDDGKWGIWDLRSFNGNNKTHSPSPVAEYDFHQSAITSINFNPLDESIIAVASEDNTVTLWDLSVEADDEEIKQQNLDNKDLKDIPPQLLFVHWQKDVKEVQWHKQLPGCLVSTGGEGLNIWKTISV